MWKSGPARLTGCLVVVTVVLSCAYPRRSTSLTEVESAAGSLSSPVDVWRLTVVEAIVTPRQRSGLPWDEGDVDAPDPFMRLYRGRELVWESEPVVDTLHPRFDQTLPRNVWLPRDRPIRLELWDADDMAGADPIGVWKGAGLPDTAVPGANARLLLEGRSTLVVRIDPPRAHRGTGVSRYEVRSDALRVIEVIERSPAGRAGVQVGDRIVAIDDENVSELGEAKAASELSLAGVRRGSRITIDRGDGARRELSLDGGYVWLTM